MERKIIHQHYFIKPGCTLTPEELAVEIAKFDKACEDSSRCIDLEEFDRNYRKTHFSIDPRVSLTPEELAIETAKFDEAAKNSTPMDLAKLDEYLRHEMPPVKETT